MAQISPDFYLLCRTGAAHVRYAPLYIKKFPLTVSRVQPEDRSRWHSYEQIGNVQDRLRWLRQSRGLRQKDAAKIAGVDRAVYADLETGVRKQMPVGVAENLAQFYGVPMADFLDAFNRFLLRDPAALLRKYRTETGMTRKAFARKFGTSVRNLEMWEKGRRTVSYKSWERYFAEVEELN